MAEVGVTGQTPLNATKIQIMPSVSCPQYFSRARRTASVPIR